MGEFLLKIHTWYVTGTTHVLPTKADLVTGNRIYQGCGKVTEVRSCGIHDARVVERSSGHAVPGGVLIPER